MTLSIQDKLLYTFYTMVLFYIVANPRTFEFVQSVIGEWVEISDNSGCPTCYGLVIHTIVFGLLLLGLMEITALIKSKSNSN
jgi:hypothetical protein